MNGMVHGYVGAYNRLQISCIAMAKFRDLYTGWCHFLPHEEVVVMAYVTFHGLMLPSSNYNLMRSSSPPPINSLTISQGSLWTSHICLAFWARKSLNLMSQNVWRWALLWVLVSLPLEALISLRQNHSDLHTKRRYMFVFNIFCSFQKLSSNSLTPDPYAPCMEYLPQIHAVVNIPCMEHLGKWPCTWEISEVYWNNYCFVSYDVALCARSAAVCGGLTQQRLWEVDCDRSIRWSDAGERAHCHVGRSQHSLSRILCR